MDREVDRKPLAMGGKIKTPHGRQDVALSDLSVKGAKIDAVYMILSPGQRIGPQGRDDILLACFPDPVGWHWLGKTAHVQFFRV